MKTKKIVNPTLSKKARKSFKERGEMMPSPKVVQSKRHKKPRYRQNLWEGW